MPSRCRSLWPQSLCLSTYLRTGARLAGCRWVTCVLLIIYTWCVRINTALNVVRGHKRRVYMYYSVLPRVEYMCTYH